MIKNRPPLHEVRNNSNVFIFPQEMIADDDKNLQSLVKFIGIKETSQSYSLLLVENESFQELAKLSSIGPIKSFFEKVIGGTMEAEFDELCQKVNSILVKMLVKASFNRFKKGKREENSCISIGDMEIFGNFKFKQFVGCMYM